MHTQAVLATVLACLMNPKLAREAWEHNSGTQGEAQHSQQCDHRGPGEYVGILRLGKTCTGWWTPYSCIIKSGPHIWPADCLYCGLLVLLDMPK